jgi:tetratricopeptide (TPR) repeat protein
VSRLIPHDLAEEVLARFLAGEATDDEKARVMQHLVRSCQVCMRYLAESEPPPEVDPFSGKRGRVFQLAPDSPQGPECWPARILPLLEELDRLPPKRRGMKGRNLPRFTSVEVALALCDRAYDARFRDHEAMLEDAELAVEVAGAGGTAKTAPPPVVADVQARAWSELGNALRVHGKLREAEKAFATAAEHLAEGSGEPGPRALYCMRLSSLRYFRRQFPQAILLLNEVVALHRSLGQSDGEAKALMKLAIVHVITGEPSAARPLLRRVLDLVGKLYDRSMRRAASHNLIRCYLDLGEAENAYTLWVKARSLFIVSADQLAEVRREWQAGEISLALGHYGAAEAYLERTREQFVDLGLAYEAAVVSLDLAEVYLHQEKLPHLLHVVLESIPIFQALGVTRDLLGALLKIHEVVGGLGRAEKVLALLRKAQAEVKLLGLG